MKYSHIESVKDLFHAAEYNQPEVVRRIIMDEGMDPNVRHEAGGTPLHFAITSGNFEIAEFLLGAGADINALATKDGIDNGMGSAGTALHWVCTNNSKSEALWLLKKGISIDRAGLDGETALHEAIKNNNNELAEILIEHRASVNHPDQYGRTPLHLAAIVGNADGVTMLLKHGARIDEQDHYKETALHYACHHYKHNGHLKSGIALIEAGADLQLKNEEGWVALDLFSGKPIQQWYLSKTLQSQLEEQILQASNVPSKSSRKSLCL